MRYEELKDLVKYYCRLYYDKNDPEVTDEEFDTLYDKLQAVEKAQGWAASDSPTLTTGSNPGKIRHPYKLYSMKKVYNQEEVDQSFTVKTPKIDGTNLTLIYTNSKLILGLTRGDGEFGDSVTHLLPTIAGIPQDIRHNGGGTIVVTGECVTDNEVENFRNYVSGALGLKDSEECASRNLRFIAHDFLNLGADYTIRLKLLQNLGFNTVLQEDFCSKYPQDGVVYRLDSYKESMKLGYTSKYPRFAVALKPRGKLTAETTLQDVVWVVGRTGTVNPVGIVEPVILDDATITRVTLHNLEFIESHKLGLGDTIEIERAGGVIPKFNRVITSSLHNLKIGKRHAEEAIGGPCHRVGPKLYCDFDSPQSTVKLLEHFVKTLGIKGLGPKSITKLDLKHPAELYQSQNWDSLGKNGTKVVEEIERSKTKPYSTVLAALGIPGVGKSLAKTIVQYIPTFQHMRDVETLQIAGVGPKISDNILAWLEVNEGWVEKLPLQLSEDQSIESVLDTHGLRKVCITGKLDMTKNQASEHLAPFGFEVTTTVTKDCYALITDGRTDSQKYEKAIKYNVNVIDYWSNRNKILKGEF